MLNTLKSSSKKLASHQVTIVMREAVANVWSANMNLFHVARNEGRKVFNAAMRKTETLKKHNITALKTGAEAANDKIAEGWTAVEKVLDTRVIPVLGKVSLATPARMGVDLVSKGLAKVSGKVVELTRGRKAPGRLAAAKTVKRMPAKKVVAKHSGAAKVRKAA